MNFLRFIPAALSSLLISAHFQRGGYSAVAVLCLLTPAIFFLNRQWAVRIVQMLLILYAVEWVRTLIHLVQIRMDHGMAWMRLAVILGTVALFTLASAFWLNRLTRRKNG